MVRRFCSKHAMLLLAVLVAVSFMAFVLLVTASQIGTEAQNGHKVPAAVAVSAGYSSTSQESGL